MRALVILLALTAEADADDWSQLAARFDEDARACTETVERAAAAAAARDRETDDEPVRLRERLGDLAARLPGYCLTFSSHADGIRELSDQRELCDTSASCADVEARLQEISERWSGWFAVLVSHQVELDTVLDRLAEIDGAKALAERFAELPGDCQGGDVSACELLGNAYATGSGVKRSKKQAKKHWKRAVKLLEGACKRHADAGACTTLAEVYEVGRLGLAKSKKQAKKYRARANWLEAEASGLNDYLRD